jgi:ATP-binding cassette subfamily F protein 3
LRVETSAATAADSAIPFDKEDRRRQHEERKEAQREEKRRLKELADLEARIGVQEAELAAIESTMADPALYQDAGRWREVSLRHETLQEEIAGLYARWEALQVPETA